MTLRVLALSPHLDDAAFSCGGSLASLAQAGCRVVMVTLFTRSVPDPKGFALACQLDKGLGPEVDYMALRRAEDQDAAARLGVEALHVDLPEAPHRGYGSAKALFAPPHEGDDIGNALRAAVERLLTDHQPDLVLAPQAIGGHVDHVQLVMALGGLSPPVLWWRDFPYATRVATPPEPFVAAFGRLPATAIRLAPGAVAAKEAACLAYRSQLGFQFGGADRLRNALAANVATELFRGAVPSAFSKSFDTAMAAAGQG